MTERQTTAEQYLDDIVLRWVGVTRTSKFDL